MRRIVSLFLLFFALWVNAAIYGWHDSAGNRHYSDRPHAGADVLDIRPGYGFYTVKKVFDGDTLMLEGGRKVRLLGINTPEVEHRNQPAQPGGDEARRWLMEKALNRKVRLETDSESADKYGRVLAHVFTDRKEHLNLQLVEQGLATVSIFPPNLRYAKPLVDAERRAEKARLGIWRRKEYEPFPVGRLNASGRSGWVRVTGRIVDLRKSRKFVYLKFSNTFEVRIEKKELALFPELGSYLGRSVEVRGWLNRYKKGHSMLIRHPSAIVMR